MTVRIADHALIRYFERIEGVRMAEVREKMRAAGVPKWSIPSDKAAIEWMEANGYPVASVRALFDQPMVENAIAVGAAKIKIDDNCWLGLKDGGVVTTMTDEMIRGKTTHKQRGRFKGQPKTRFPYYPGKPKRRRRK
jgi:hypothetical protein